MKSFLPVLIFQKIGKSPATSRLKNQWTTPRKLERILAFLVKHGYHFITPLDLQNLPAKPILLVFMGGYQSFYSEVFPLLQKYNLHATCAVAVNTLDTYDSWKDPYQEPWQNILTSDQLKEIVASGLVQIATLGLTGKDLLQAPLAQAKQEISESIYRLKKLYQIDACAIAFWSKNSDCKDFFKTLPLITITPTHRDNALSLRTLSPTWLTRLRLLFHK